MVWYPYPFSYGTRWLLASSVEPYVTFHLPPWYWSLLGSFCFLHSWPRQLLRNLTTCVHSLQVWVEYIFGLEGMDGHGVVRCGFYGDITASWRVECYRFFPVFFQLLRLFNFCHLVHRWCSATHTFFLSCGEITITLKDVANQLLLSILGDTDPTNIELSAEEEVVEAELKKGMSGNMKLLH